MDERFPERVGREVRLSVLDVGVCELSAALAPRVEALGYERYWLSEHHGEGLIPAPMVLVPVVAGATKRMRVGTAGVLLRYQSTLAIAESFRTLSRLFDGRVDLGLARGVASPALSHALLDGRGDSYTEAYYAAKVDDVRKLVCGSLEDDHPLAGERVNPPLASAGPPQLWVHSTSSTGAELAARLGCHYSFHDHYARAKGPDSIRRYVEEFRASPELARPSWAVAMTGYCAESDADARAVRERYFAKLPAGRHVVVGTSDYWRDELGRLALDYVTRDFVVETLGGRYDLGRQVASFARIADIARTLGN